MTFGTGLALLIWLTALLLTLVGTYLTLKAFRSPPPHLDAPFGLFPVSILKPLKGRDEGLKENLESFFMLDYPDYELIFSVADAHDPACAVVRELRRSYPSRRAQLIIGAVDVGPNPKVNNLVRSYEAARHGWILISDSNVRVPADYLKRMVAHIDADVGMITSVVAGRSPQGVGAALESVYLNTFYARGMHLAASAGRPCVVGKSMLFRRSDSDRFGGIKALGRYLAEDFMAGEAMRKLGRRVVLAADPVYQHIGKYTFGDFWSRHLRWGRIRKAQAPLTFVIEPFLASISSGIIGAWGASRCAGISMPIFLTFHLLLWAACDLMVVRSMKVRLSIALPLAWFARELLHFPLWLHIASGNSVQWRGRKFALHEGGMLKKCPATF